eukprot:SAG31_NODE_865_length_11376_cov_4.313377_2_plen_58_part_00
MGYGFLFVHVDCKALHPTVLHTTFNIVFRPRIFCVTLSAKGGWVESLLSLVEAVLNQ